MALTRLALSMDEDVVARARRLADVRDTSISKLFVSFVCLMEQEQTKTRELPPLTKRALGLAKATVPEDWDYKSILAEELSVSSGLDGRSWLRRPCRTSISCRPMAS